MAKKKYISGEVEGDRAEYQSVAMKTIMIFIVLCVGYLAVMTMTSYFGVKDDSLAEEAIEAAIQTTTGVSVDLSPQSPE